MVKAAVADNEFFEASRIELDRSGPSYTADTVMHIRRTYDKAVAINLIIGGDNVRHLRQWYNADYLIEQCRFLVAPRLVYERSLVHKPPVLETVQEQSQSRYHLEGARVGIIDFPATSISSSAVRKRLAEGRSVLYMVPGPVNDILVEKKFYTTGTASSV
jgi:nicotinate-nucleotide adenylyltransferase